MKLSNSSTILIYLLFTLISCDSSEKEQLRHEIEKLRSEIKDTEAYNNTMASQINEVDMMLDSIERSQNILNTQLERGTTYTDYAERLNFINEYINNSKTRLKEMEDKLGQSDQKNQTFIAMIAKLRTSIADKESSINALNDQVEKYKTENEGLITTVELQKQKLSQQKEEIEAKEQELADLETRINNLSEEAQKKEADSYFERALQMEEIASRTKFAPKKKKESLKEAHRLYKKAFELGRIDAFEKMEDLEQRY
ncbi:hypothetical protein [Chondrinema litorale]|uniref:hypothetical protein n=1 Tax=Chondrinema litorale TaxID=2994555 RepID=UPI002542F725|nr:hypothetical protein [Chondrinema litorale]UZR95515.1 hypothetical protein OQ292_06775 [Chondrinema litorale]